MLLDSGADSNFLPSAIAKIGRLTKLDQPITATTATNKRHQITHSVDFTITKPFKLQFQAYVLPGLRKIILGRPTLQQLRYELTPTSEFITIAGHNYNCTLERANGLIKKILRGLIGPLLPNWDSVLYKAVQIYNGTPTIHGHTPYFLAMGISTHLSNYRDQLVQAFPPLSTEAEFNEEVAMLRLHEFVVKGKSVDKHNDAKTQKMAYQKMMSAPFGIPANFQKGQWIYRRRKKLAKNQYNFDGPFLIEEVRNNNSYIISRNGKREKGTYHQDMLKPAFALEDSPITALSNFQKSMQEIEYRVLGKMFDEIKVRVIMLSDIMKNRKPVKIDAVMTHPQFYERERVML